MGVLGVYVDELICMVYIGTDFSKVIR